MTRRSICGVKNMNNKGTMKLLKNPALLAALVGGTLLTNACKKDEASTPDPTPTPSNVQVLQDSISTDMTLTNDKVWLLTGFFKVKAPATLTIQAGTVIKGDKPTKGTLIIERGAKISAIGDASHPIVFTSNQAPGSRSYGDWGGVILCGKSPNNQGNDVLLEGGTGALFGGTDPNDNSGVMQYVRIEFPGVAFQPNNEINGLTLGAVGAGTTIDHIQVSYSGDDSYEWFGGSVNCKYLIALRGWDDDFDTDNGFIGKLQFGVGLRDNTIADQSGSNGFESDNDAAGDGLTPITHPIFSNFSVFGPLTVDANVANMNALFKRGAHLRRNTQECLYNTIVSGYPTGILIDASAAEQNAISNLLQVRNSEVAQWSSLAVDTISGGTFDVTSWYNTGAFANGMNADIAALGLHTPFQLTAPNFIPTGTSSLLSGADFSNPNLSDAFFTPVSYKGAFGSSDWTSGWTNFDPQNTSY